MATLKVHWKARTFNIESQQKLEDTVRTGVLTGDEDEVADEQPVIIEDLTGRVYGPRELPPGTVVYVAASPGPLPPLAQRARDAGFTVRAAEEWEAP
jgi:hypothetical protein